MKYKRICKNCEATLLVSQEDTWWIERGTYSEKVYKCPRCKAVNTIKYKDAAGLNVNYESRH